MKGSTCSKPYHFVFEWNLKDRQSPPNSTFLRLHMQSCDDHFPDDTSIAVNVSVKLLVANRSAESGGKANEGKPYAFLRSFDVEKNSSGWLEFNLTDLIADDWDKVREGAFVGITLKFEVRCKLGEKLPMEIIHSIALKAHRRKLSAFQPFLVLASGSIQEAMARSSHVPSLDLSMEQSERMKRDILGHICLLENFTVNFKTLGFRQIIRPITLNIKQCVGSCSINHAPAIGSITTNHARLMISATATHDLRGKSSLNPSLPKDPCCTPISYNPTYLIVGYREAFSSIRMRKEEEMIVEECGCR